LFLQLSLSGFSQGAIYALVALSLTVVFRATTIVNFGHGDMVMTGAFTTYVLVMILKLPYYPAAALALVAVFLLGYAVQRGLIDPVKSGPHVGLAMMSIAVGYILRGVARAGWGREVLPMPRVFDYPPIILGDLVITGDSLVIIGTVTLLLAAFFFILHGTSIGKVIQAVYQSERGAALVGVNVRQFHALMWAVGAALGGVGGMLVAPVTLLHPELGAVFLINGFAAMTLGGFGSLVGAVVGGLLIGWSEQLIGGYVSTKLIDMTPYLVIIFVLLIRPVGLFGRATVVRV